MEAAVAAALVAEQQRVAAVMATEQAKAKQEIEGLRAQLHTVASELAELREQLEASNAARNALQIELEQATTAAATAAAAAATAAARSSPVADAEPKGASSFSASAFAATDTALADFAREHALRMSESDRALAVVEEELEQAQSTIDDLRTQLIHLDQRKHSSHQRTFSEAALGVSTTQSQAQAHTPAPAPAPAPAVSGITQEQHEQALAEALLDAETRMHLEMQQELRDRLQKQAKSLGAIHEAAIASMQLRLNEAERRATAAEEAAAAAMSSTSSAPSTTDAQAQARATEDAQLEATINDLRAQLEQQHQLQQQQQQQHPERAQTAEATFEALESDRDDLRREVTRLTQTVTDLSAQLQAAATEHHRLAGADRDDTPRSAVDAAKQVSSLQIQLDDVRAQLAEQTVSGQEQQMQLAEALATLSAQAGSEARRDSRAMATAQEEDDGETLNASSNTLVASLQQQLTQTAAELEDARGQIAALESELREAEQNALSNLRQTQLHAQEIISNLQAQIEVLETESKQHTTHTEESNNSVGHETEQQQVPAQEHERALDELRTQMQQHFDEQLQQSDANIATLRQSVKELQQELSNARASSADAGFESTHGSAATTVSTEDALDTSLADEVSALRSQVAELRSAAVQHSDFSSRVEQTLNELEAEMTQKDQRISELESLCHQAREEANSLRECTNAVQPALQAIAEVGAQMHEKDDELLALREQLLAKDAEISALREQLAAAVALPPLLPSPSSPSGDHVAVTVVDEDETDRRPSQAQTLQEDSRLQRMSLQLRAREDQVHALTEQLDEFTQTSAQQSALQDDLIEQLRAQLLQSGVQPLTMTIVHPNSAPPSRGPSLPSSPMKGGGEPTISSATTISAAAVAASASAAGGAAAHASPSSTPSAIDLAMPLPSMARDATGSGLIVIDALQERVNTLEAAATSHAEEVAVLEAQVLELRDAAAHHADFSARVKQMLNELEVEMAQKDQRILDLEASAGCHGGDDPEQYSALQATYHKLGGDFDELLSKTNALQGSFDTTVAELAGALDRVAATEAHAKEQIVAAENNIADLEASKRQALKTLQQTAKTLRAERACRKELQMQAEVDGKCSPSA